MSTDKDALREKAERWLEENHPRWDEWDQGGCDYKIDSLAALLTAERADAVAQERGVIDLFVQIQGVDADPAAKDLAERVIDYIRARQPRADYGAGESGI